MAVKERKQITGTTAQIQAYKGHEGQIVWDKEKKTLVGMSGTAGKNYPLAPQAYVDNEVSKVNAEVAKKQPKGDYATNEQLAQGLAGKEDKGTCLPLTGGTLTGGLTFGSFTINSSADGNDIFISDHGTGRISLFNTNHAQYPGYAAFTAIKKNGDIDNFVINPLSEFIEYRGKPMDVIEEFGSGYIRYKSGLQILALNAPTSSSGGGSINFPLPFTGVWGASITGVYGGNAVTTQFTGISSTNAQFFTHAVNIGGVSSTCFMVIVGAWK